ncbi:hypothetical protein YC2023_004543 [Brassica napus]
MKRLLQLLSSRSLAPRVRVPAFGHGSLPLGGVTDWFLLVLGPILRSDFLQSLVPAGTESYPQIRSPQSPFCRFWVPTQSRCLQLLTPAGFGFALHNKSQQPSDPMGAAITKQAQDDIHTSRLTTPPHMRKMQGSQVGHDIFCRGLQLGRILKTGGVRRRAAGNIACVPGNH